MNKKFVFLLLNTGLTPIIIGVLLLSLTSSHLHYLYSQEIVTKVWTRQLGTASDDEDEGVAVDSSGNIYVTGSTESYLWAWWLSGTSALRPDIYRARTTY